MSLLKFEIKRGLQSLPRIYVISAKTNQSYGSFIADGGEQFEGWDKLSLKESVELKHYIDNLNAVKDHIGDKYLTQQAVVRFRLPLDYIEIIDQISLLAYQAETPFNFYEGLVAATIQSIKIAVAKLPLDSKRIALEMLEGMGLAEYKKIDHTTQIKAIFVEVSSIHNKSELLGSRAVQLFGKTKTYSPTTISNWATGERFPGKWITSCAIDLLLTKKTSFILKMLSIEDIAILWAKPLLNNNQYEYVYKRVKELGLNQVQEIIDAPNFPINNKIEE